MFVADLHNDVLQRAIIGQDIITHSNQGHTDIDRLILSGINLEVFVIWVTKKHLQLKHQAWMKSYLIPTLSLYIFQKHPTIQ